MWDKVEGVESRRYIDDKQVISKKEAVELFKVKERTIERYLKDGMPKHPQSQNRFLVLDVEECREWILLNIKASRVSKKQIEETLKKEVYEDEDGIKAVDLPKEQVKVIIQGDANIRKLVGDADKASEDALSAKLKRMALEGTLVEAESLSIAQAEQAAIYITNYINDKKVLQTLLKNKEPNEIKDILEDHYSKRMQDLDKLINREFKDCDKSLYEIIFVVLRFMRDGIAPDAIIDALKRLA